MMMSFKYSLRIYRQGCSKILTVGEVIIFLTDYNDKFNIEMCNQK